MASPSNNNSPRLIKASFNDFSKGLREDIKTDAFFNGVNAANNADFVLTTGAVQSPYAFVAGTFSHLPAGYSLLKYFKTSSGEEFFVAKDGSGNVKLLYGNGSTNAAEWTPPTLLTTATPCTLTIPASSIQPYHSAYTTTIFNTTTPQTVYPYVDSYLGTGITSLWSSYDSNLDWAYPDCPHNYYLLVFEYDDNTTMVNTLLTTKYVEWLAVDNHTNQYKGRSFVMATEQLHYVSGPNVSDVVIFLCEGVQSGVYMPFGTSGINTTTTPFTINCYSDYPNFYNQNQLPTEAVTTDPSKHSFIFGELSGGARLYTLNTTTNISSHNGSLGYANKAFPNFTNKQLLPIQTSDWNSAFTTAPTLKGPAPSADNRAFNTTPTMNGVYPLDLDYQNEGGYVTIWADNAGKTSTRVSESFTGTWTYNGVGYNFLNLFAIVTFVTDDGQEFIPYTLRNTLGFNPADRQYGWFTVDYSNAPVGYGVFGTSITQIGSGTPYYNTFPTNFRVSLDASVLGMNVKYMRLYLAALVDQHSAFWPPSNTATTAQAVKENAMPELSSFLLYDQIDLTDHNDCMGGANYKHTFTPYYLLPQAISSWNIPGNLPKFMEFTFTVPVSVNSQPTNDSANVQFNSPLSGGVSLAESLGYATDVTDPQSANTNLGDFILNNVGLNFGAVKTSCAPFGLRQNLTTPSAPVSEAPLVTDLITNKFQMQDVFSAMAIITPKVWGIRASNGYLAYSAVGTAPMPDLIPQENVLKILAERYKPIGITTISVPPNQSALPYIVVWDTTTLFQVNSETFQLTGTMPVGGLGVESIVALPAGIFAAGTSLIRTNFQESEDLTEVIRDTYYSISGEKLLFYDPSLDRLLITSRNVTGGLGTVISMTPQDNVVSLFAITASNALVEFYVDPVTGLVSCYDTAGNVFLEDLSTYSTSSMTFTTPHNVYNEPSINKMGSFLFLAIDCDATSNWTLTLKSGTATLLTIIGQGPVEKNYRMPRVRHRRLYLSFTGSGTTTTPLIFREATVYSIPMQDINVQRT